MLGYELWECLMPSNYGLQADGWTAVVCGAVVSSKVGGGAAPTAQRGALGYLGGRNARGFGGSIPSEDS